jgi:hypothetical protein
MPGEQSGTFSSRCRRSDLSGERSGGFIQRTLRSTARIQTVSVSSRWSIPRMFRSRSNGVTVTIALLKSHRNAISIPMGLT